MARFDWLAVERTHLISRLTSSAEKRAIMKKSGTRKIRYAVVGLGHITQVAVLPAFRSAKNSELVALVTGDPKKERKLAKKYRIDRVYTYEQFEDCLAEGVDAVYIALPNHLHREYTVRALNA